MSRFIRPILLLSPLPFVGAITYTYASRQLAKDFPEVPLEQLPDGSFTRRIVEESRARGLARWNEEGKDGGKRDLYAAYYDIYQTTLPRSSLECYGQHLLQGSLSRSAYLTSSYTHALMNSGLMSLERKMMRTKPDVREEKGVWERGMEVVGGTMWILGSSASSSPVAPPTQLASTSVTAATDLPSEHEPPCSPPASFTLQNLAPEQGSTVLFWRMPPGPVQAFDKLAEYGYPWRMMLGGWHELLVEELPSASGSLAEGEEEAMVRLTFTCVHVYDSLGRDDRKVIPKWVRGVHETFARALLGSAKRKVERG